MTVLHNVSSSHICNWLGLDLVLCVCLTFFVFCVSLGHVVLVLPAFVMSLK